MDSRRLLVILSRMALVRALRKGEITEDELSRALYCFAVERSLVTIEEIGEMSYRYLELAEREGRSHDRDPVAEDDNLKWLKGVAVWLAARGLPVDPSKVRFGDGMDSYYRLAEAVAPAGLVLIN